MYAVISATGLIIGIISLASSSQRSMAQEIEDEIFVTGQLQERSFQDTHSSVTVITGEQLDKDTLTDLFDIFERTANVSVTQGGFGFAIRGVADTGVGGAGSGLAVDINVDGASTVTSQGIRTGSLSTWDLQQVEVLRGPQSTQQGRNALAGSVYIRSKDPTFEQELKARVDYGEYEEYRLALAGNQPLIDDKLAVRAAYEDFRTDSAWENPTLGTDDVGRRKLQTWRAKLRFQPIESLNMVLGHSVSDNILGNNHVNLDAWSDERLNFSNEENIEEGETSTTNLRIRYDLNERWTLRSETTVYENDYRTFQDADSTAADFGSGGRDIIDESISQEFRIGYQSERLNGVAGLFYTDIDTDLDFLAIIPGALFGLPTPGTVELGNTQDTRLENVALYGEIDYRPNRHWTLTAGFRVDNEEREDRLTSTFAGTTTPSRVFDTDYNAFLPKLGLAYHWTEYLSTGLTIQRGYRAGGSGLTSLGDQFEYDAEFTTNYELSLRSVHIGGRLIANANLFYTRWEDQQVNVEGPSGTFLDTVVTNAGKSELYGVEFELSYMPTDNFDSYFSIGFTDTEFREFVTGGVDLAGNEFPYAPHLTASLGGTYRFAGGFAAQLNGSYTDEVHHSPQNFPEEVADSYFLLDARLGYQVEKWSAFIYARNLLDKDYLSRRRLDGFNNAGEPRVIGVTANYAF